MHPNAGRKHTPEHIRLRVESTARTKAQWTDERRQQVSAAVSESLRRRDPKLIEKFASVNVGRTPWNKGNNWRNKLTPEEVRAITAARMRSLRARSPKHRINARMSAMIRQALKHAKAGRSWEQLVGYTVADLLKHLENKFQPGMTWDNADKWHIDHIKPRASFSFESVDDPQFRECWSLQNLQPLWAADNLRKRASIL